MRIACIQLSTGENYDINFSKKIIKKTGLIFKMIKNPYKSILYLKDKFQ